MNRFKLVLIIIVLALIGILLAQNRQLLLIKFLCPEVNDSNCLYQTPSLPLAAWMILFAIAGLLSSLIWQYLIQVNSSSKLSNSRKSYYTDRPFDKPQAKYSRPQAEVKTTRVDTTVSDWEKTSAEDWDIQETKTPIDEKVVNNYEVKAKPPSPQNLNRGDSVYSYKFREASPKKNEQSNTTKSSNKVDEVYDAPYRTVDSSSAIPNSPSVDDDEEWI